MMMITQPVYQTNNNNNNNIERLLCLHNMLAPVINWMHICINALFWNLFSLNNKRESEKWRAKEKNEIYEWTNTYYDEM